MNSNRFKFFSKSILFVDILLTVNSFFIAYFIRNVFFGKVYGFLSQFSRYTWIVVMAAIIIPIFMSIFKSYERILEDKCRMIVLRTVVSVFTGIICMSAILFLAGDQSLSRLFLGIFGCTEVFAILLERIILKALIIFYSKNNIHKKNILIVGCGNTGKIYYERVKEHNRLDLNVIGFIALKASGSDEENGIKVIGTISDLGSIAKRYNASEAVVALSAQEYGELQNVLSVCDREGLRVSIIPSYIEYLKVNMRVENMSGVPIINVREVPLDSIENRILKRIFDIIVSFLAIIILSPVYVMIALGVKLTSPGPMLFKQERVGAGNKPFMMLKFRSMCIQKEDDEKTKWTTPNDTRVTKFGAFIRKTSLDELPQFFNVLKGDMSIIGPRPERPYWVEKFKDEVPNYMLRHYIKTGITGWAQVNGYRGDTSIEERINCDNFYIHNWSMRMDIKIMFLTVIETLVRRNAY
ncbi:Undecaprenyl-phosphate glucose phosphotransferase [Ruminiclostridium sufflavum DSM 19573]|uniref:Undecaprenyl-phosphate glucose phosphotransferase n=1 Tax=Ruminiclostridium sufflavum DSM 19573 TaxID=1121337 RepID=A0A318XQB9_9FIRM|nr:undecaprenyl-phosphate glucose phosphotransferase [Ruminiclostridium sufflavum]PYG89468.1 Undecaprenyl-phosphate glucose phosphotransferase [Ruminiclostridium sufflavum DSM 19573]